MAMKRISALGKNILVSIRPLIIPPKTAHVLHDDGRHLSALGFGDKSLPIVAIKIRPVVAIVYKKLPVAAIVVDGVWLSNCGCCWNRPATHRPTR